MQVKSYNQPIKFLFPLLVVLSFLYACGNNRIDEETFVQIYSELLVAKEKFKENGNAYLNEREKIFKSYNVSKTQVDATLDYYNSDPERWKPFFEKVVKNLERIQLTAFPK